MLSGVNHHLTSPELWLRSAWNPSAPFSAPRTAASKALHTVHINALHELTHRTGLQVSHICASMLRKAHTSVEPTGRAGCTVSLRAASVPASIGSKWETAQ